MNWEPAAILADGPLKSLRINDVDYRVGTLSTKWVDHYQNEHMWTVERLPHKADAWLAVRGLLEAGNENLNWEEIEPHLTIDLILPAAREVCRQAILQRLKLYESVGLLTYCGSAMLRAANA